MCLLWTARQSAGGAEEGLDPSFELGVLSGLQARLLPGAPELPARVREQEGSHTGLSATGG